MSDVAVTKESPRKLPESHFKQSEFVRAHMDAELPLGHTIDDTLKPEYWAHVAYRLQKDALSGAKDRAGAIIRVTAIDMSFTAELFVRAVQEQGLVVELLKPDARGVCWLGPNAVESDRFETRWNVGKRGFDIIRESDREIVADGSVIKTREMAKSWIDETMRPR